MSEWKVSEGEEGKIKSDANYVQNERKTEETTRIREHRLLTRDRVMGAGWGGRLHTGGLIPYVVLFVCVCVFHLRAGRWLFTISHNSQISHPDVMSLAT